MEVVSCLTLISLTVSFVRLGFPSSAGETRGLRTFLPFNAEGGGWLPTLPVVDLPLLIGTDLFETVQKKKPTAGSLDGWEGAQVPASCLV